MGKGEAVGKGKRGEELSYPVARHSLWEQGELEATMQPCAESVAVCRLSGGRGGGTGGQGGRICSEEDKRNSEAIGSEWNDSEEGLPEATGAGLAGLVHR